MSIVRKVKRWFTAKDAILSRAWKCGSNSRWHERRAFLSMVAGDRDVAQQHVERSKFWIRRSNRIYKALLK